MQTEPLWNSTPVHLYSADQVDHTLLAFRGNPSLPSNYAVRAHRARVLVHKLASTPDLLHKYNEILADQE